ncbi:MAG: hypothetical protein ACREBC_38870, partial [Pyrinomonadaceae bacterium]
MSTLRFKHETNRTATNRTLTNRAPENLYSLLRRAGRSLWCLMCGLACALLLATVPVQGQQKNQRFQDVAWPQFRGPESNPVGTHARLAERWSKTENVEWSQT